MKELTQIDPKNHVAVVVKAACILELFTEREPRLPLATIMERTGFSRTTVYRLLSTLERIGWITRHGEAYGLSLRLFRLGATAVNALDVRQEAGHIMSDLAARVGTDVYLVVVDGARAVCLERIEGSTEHVRVMALDVGRSLPLFVGGAPVALLAELEGELLPLILKEAPLITPTGLSLDEEALRAKLQETRDRGYARSMEDVTFGIGAFGVPIFDAQRRAVAALSVGGLLHVLEPREAETARSLRQAAAAISYRLGYVE